MKGYSNMKVMMVQLFAQLNKENALIRNVNGQWGEMVYEFEKCVNTNSGLTSDKSTVCCVQ